MLTTRERYLIWMAYASFARKTNYDERNLIEKAEEWLNAPICNSDLERVSLVEGFEGVSSVEEFISKAADNLVERHGE